MPFYTPPANHSISFENDSNYIIPVIASFNTKGDVQPLYFQFDEKTIKIDSVHWCEKKWNAYYFECTAALSGYLTEINLTFYPENNRWTMKIRS